MSDKSCTKLQELLSEIRDPDTQLITTIRIAYESGLDAEFLIALQGFVLDYEETLKTMCSNNYKSLVNSMDDVANFNGQFGELKDELSCIDNEVYLTASDVQDDIDLVAKLKNAMFNIGITIEFITKCLPALETFVLLSNEIERNVRKSLDYIRYLEHELLPSVQNFRFIQKIAICLPTMKQKIKETARKEMLGFLQKAREQQELIGKIIINNAMASTGKTTEFTMDISVGISDYLDFTLLCRYMLVIEELGVSNIEDQYYRSERTSQAKLLYEWQKPTNDDTLKAFVTYIYQVTGFFVIEAYITNTIQNTFSKCQLNEIFNKCSNRLLYQLEMFGVLKSSDEVTSLRTLVGYFQHVMQNCDLTASVTKECDNILKHQYIELMCANASRILKKIEDPKLLHPLIAENKEEEDQIFSTIPIPAKMKDMQYPRKFPFSIYVPTVYDEIFKFIELWSKYHSEDANTESDMESEIKIKTKHFLMSVVRRSLVEIYGKCTTLSEYVNAYSDAYFLDTYLPYLDHKVNSLAKSGGSKSGQIIMKDEAIFKSVQADIEQSMLMHILKHIDPCLSNIANQTDAKGQSDLKKMDTATEKFIAFLKGTASMLQHISSTTVGNIFIQICKHVNSNTLDLLSGRNHPLSRGAFEHIYEDIGIIINYLSEIEIPHVENATKELFTRELQQTMEVVKKDDWLKYFSQFNSAQSDYDFVQPLTLFKIYNRIYMDKVSKQDNKNVFQRFFKSDNSDALKPQDILDKLQSLI